MGEPAKRSAGTTPVLQTSVATLCSNLVTRPTGRAVRAAIEHEIGRTAGLCLAVLDFSQVGVLDFSCADEVIAKLLYKYRRPDRPSEAFFLLQGVSEHHREPIETVLRRHKLLVVALEPGGPALWGRAPSRLRMTWDWLGQLGRAFSDELARARGLSAPTARAWLRRLVIWRVAVPEADGGFASLTALFQGTPTYGPARTLEVGPQRAAAEESARYGPETEGGGETPRVGLPI